MAEKPRKIKAMPEIKNYEELYAECDECRARAEYAFCEDHYKKVIDDAMEDGRKEEARKTE